MVRIFSLSIHTKCLSIEKKFQPSATDVLTLKPLETIFFDIPLTEENFATAHLKLPSTFASYLKENDMKDILLCGDHGNKLDFTVINMTDPTNTCLAYDWKYFSSLNFYKPGVIIRFKFNLYDINGKCHVYKLSN
ncbi:hypothetical protein P8452_37670 [Trifolium repens]|nr:hypothetical protein P8452_37670 [Trifolium repens]